MRVLLVSHKFAPDVGGIETMSELLAGYLVKHGHEVTVVTHTTPDDGNQRPFGVARRPSMRRLHMLHKQADVVFHNNICLRFAWPLLVVKRPWVVAVRTWIARNSGRIGPRDRLKRVLLRRAHVIAISSEVADHIDTPSTVILNGYRDALFSVTNASPRDPRQLVFVGRLVESKGVHVLLEAMRNLDASITLEIIGSGPDEPALRDAVEQLGLASRVVFVGQLTGVSLVERLNSRGTLIVPSLWNEPFGIVALEGMATGCWVIASAGGGLGEAVGDAGLTFANGDPAALEQCIRRLVEDRRLRTQLTSRASLHLKAHTTEAMASRYLEILEHVGGTAR